MIKPLRVGDTDSTEDIAFLQDKVQELIETVNNLEQRLELDMSPQADASTPENETCGTCLGDGWGGHCPTCGGTGKKHPKGE